MLEFLSTEHQRFRRIPGARPTSDELEITSTWTLMSPAPASPMTNRMVADFQRFCQTCLDLPLTIDSATGQTGQVVWQLTGEDIPFDRQDAASESFRIAVENTRITISARHARGLLHGTHFLEWLMADRGGPFIPRQDIERTPAFMPRIANGIFIHGHQSLTNPGEFPDDYLALLSHYGTNGIHLYLDLWTVFRSTTLPELNSPDFDTQIAALRALCKRTEVFGIDIYLHINTPALMEDHPVFLAHPDTRGSLVEIFMEEISGRPWYNLCSGSTKVLAGYSEALEALFRAAPETAGMMMIIGGECFFHCFTRPANSPNGDTNCPHCHGKSPSLEIAALVNTAAKAVKSADVNKALYAWPYSAWIWSSQDPAEIEWIKHLEPSVSVLSNFDCGDTDEALQSGVRFFDYNIKCIGPSTTFARQAETLQSLGRPIYTKIETCTTPDAFFLPYLPLPYRWYERFTAMKNMGVAGYVGQWRFYGANASPSEELQYKITWNDVSGPDELLRTRCHRDFGLTGSAADDVLRGWKHLSDAWDDFPYSSMTAGERAAYMRGPFYLGPAHPLIFDVQDHYKLPLAFRTLRGDLRELAASEEEFAEMQRHAKPRYVSDLLVTLPFGVERYLEVLTNCRTQWQAGLSLLRHRLSNQGTRARMELDICETIDAHLRTLENVVRFYQLRDRLQSEPTNSDLFRSRLSELVTIIDDEIANAERMIPILNRDFRIGYGHSYGPVYDAEMVQAKITQCRFVRDTELPRFSKVIRFHVWGESP